MALESTIFYGLFIVLCMALYFFVRHGRQLGYEALAQRTQQLQSEVNHVYLMLPAQEAPSYRRYNSLPGAGGWFALVRYLLVTGYLAYIRGDELVIEAPWWNRMQCDSTWLPQSLTNVLESDTDKTYRVPQSMPGLILGDKLKYRCYIVAGCNVTDAKCLRQALLHVDADRQADYIANRENLLDELEQSGCIQAADDTQPYAPHS